MQNNGNEFISFITFCQIVTKFPSMPFYTFDDVMIRKLMQVYKQVFAFNLPELCEHFELEGIHPRHYLFDWFMTLFSRVFDDL